MDEVTNLTPEQLDAMFEGAQRDIVRLQELQTRIDKVRRQRYAESQRGELEKRRAELAAFEKSLEV
jgi:DNA-binding IclR family transcriptional regulator